MTYRVTELEQEILRLKKWIDDLQSGMYINCVYCGHRYGPNSKVPTSMQAALKKHIEQCPAHPMHEMRVALEESVKLQSHYAMLINMHDGGERIQFANADAWLARLRDAKARNNPAEARPARAPNSGAEKSLGKPKRSSPVIDEIRRHVRSSKS